jgi:CYTH domain-containing protein
VTSLVQAVELRQAISVGTADHILNPSAPLGKSQQYAKPEWERRFLLASLPANPVLKTAKITDRYFRGTRLRLRSMLETSGDVTHTYYKLTQKIPAAEGGPGLLSTLYLNKQEFDFFSALPGATLQKTRYSIPPFGIDVFERSLAGLVLAECEFENQDMMTSFVPSIEILAEVTSDSRFNGGRLVTMNAEDVAELLAPFGVAL